MRKIYAQNCECAKITHKIFGCYFQNLYLCSTKL